MKKIISKHKQAKKKKRDQLIISLVMVLILLVSVFGYAFGGNFSDGEEINYGGYEFAEEGGYWYVEISGYEFSFRYSPEEIETIGSGLHFLEDYYEKPLYISSDDIESESEIYRNLLYHNEVIQRMQLACLEGETCTNAELPIKTCEDNFIIIKEADTASITQVDNCVFIRGPAEDLAKITDGFLLKIIGVQ